jgi:serine/threonine-protein kinase
VIGRTIGNYKIDGKLGEGGMGTVYHGVDILLDREVAIKVLRPEHASKRAVVERFRTEAVNLAKLNHPNIATLFSMLSEGDEFYMVLEFVRGETLDVMMRRRGVLPVEEAVPAFCQVLDGIDHAHELGIVHRDLKPGNIMVTERGTLKVLDFGIARLFGSSRMTRAGNIVGTLEYMSPEQVRGHETDGRSDIYSLGMVLYEMLTGRVPLEHDSEYELMKLQIEETPSPPRQWNPAIPETVETAIMRSIEKRPKDRFQTAGDFRESLLEAGFDPKAVLHGVSGPHLPLPTQSRPAISRETVVRVIVPDVTSQPPLKKTGRAPYAVLGAGVLVLIGIGAVLFMLANNRQTVTPSETPTVIAASPTPAQDLNVNTAPTSTPTPRPERPRVTPANSGKDNSNSPANSPVVVIQNTPKPSPTPKKESIWKKPWKIFTGH